MEFCYHPFPEAIVFDEENISLVANAIRELFHREREGMSSKNKYLYELCLNANTVFKKLSHTLYTSCHDLGGNVNWHLISAVVQNYEKMGMGELKVYRTDLEQKLLDDTRLGHYRHPGRHTLAGLGLILTNYVWG